MTLSDFQIEALRALLRSRVDGEKMYLTYGELAEDMGRDRARDAEAVAGALDALGACPWNGEAPAGAKTLRERFLDTGTSPVCFSRYS